MWADTYVGLPFRPDGRDRTGLDCWGLLRLVYTERLGIELPCYAGVFDKQDAPTLKRIADLMQRDRQSWEEVYAPQEYDAMLIRLGGCVASHVGVYLGGNLMLHITDGIDASIEPTDGNRWKQRIIGAFRHADRR